MMSLCTIYGYWNPVQFNQLKTALCGKEAAAGREAKGPFSIILVTRKEKRSLSEYDKALLMELLDTLIDDRSITNERKQDADIEKSRFFNKKRFQEAAKLDEESVRKIQRYEDNEIRNYMLADYEMKSLKPKQVNEIKSDLKTMREKIIAEKQKNSTIKDISGPGFVIFNEYFFGINPIPLEAAKEICKEFSSIGKQKVFFCNFIISEPNSAYTLTEKARFLSFMQPELDQRSARCVTSVDQMADSPLIKIRNQSILAHFSNILWSLNKSTYF